MSNVVTISEYLKEYKQMAFVEITIKLKWNPELVSRGPDGPRPIAAVNIPGPLPAGQGLPTEKDLVEMLQRIKASPRNQFGFPNELYRLAMDILFYAHYDPTNRVDYIQSLSVSGSKLTIRLKLLDTYYDEKPNAAELYANLISETYNVGWRNNVEAAKKPLLYKNWSKWTDRELGMDEIQKHYPTDSIFVSSDYIQGPEPDSRWLYIRGGLYWKDPSLVSVKELRMPGQKQEPARKPARKPAKKPASRKPAKKPASRKPAKKPAVRKPAKKPADRKRKPAKKPAASRKPAKKPAARKPANRRR